MCLPVFHNEVFIGIFEFFYKMMKRIIVIFRLCILLFSGSIMAKSNINVLYITGHTDKYHSCEDASEYLVPLLKEQDIFNTEVYTMGINLHEGSIDFEKYDVVVLNINQVVWDETVKSDFVNYVSSGGGLVVMHEADNAFPEWREYNRMIGLAGWGDRDKEAGPYYYWKDGVFVKDYETSGPCGWHGQRVPFMINVRQSMHPIMKNLPSAWLHINDELYGNLRGPAENMEVLATGFSDEKTGGSGKEEPVLFTVAYGKGRVFHCVLGHTSKGDNKALQNVGYQLVYVRGVEWAATGDVTIALPDNMPSAELALQREL